MLIYIFLSKINKLSKTNLIYFPAKDLKPRRLFDTDLSAPRREVIMIDIINNNWRVRFGDCLLVTWNIYVLTEIFTYSLKVGKNI